MLPVLAAGKLGGRTIVVLAVVFLFLSTQGYGQPQAAASLNPFRDLAGSWAGTGTVALSNGSEERIRCRARYLVEAAGNTLQQHLRCASASYQFDLSSDVSHRAGTISGHWTEKTRNAGGAVSGSVTGAGRIQAVVDGPGFSASLSVTTRGNRQSVHLVSRGQDMTQVSITLTRT